MKARDAGWRCSACGHAEGKGFNGLECPRCGTEVEGLVVVEDEADSAPDLDDVDIDNAVILYFREIDRVP